MYPFKIHCFVKSSAPLNVARTCCGDVGDIKDDPGRTRTCNPRLRRPMPYPLGHGAKCQMIANINVVFHGELFLRGNQETRKIKKIKRRAETHALCFQTSLVAASAECAQGSGIGTIINLKTHSHTWGTWCSGITSASHAEGPGFKSQCVHLFWYLHNLHCTIQLDGCCLRSARMRHIHLARIELATFSV